MPSILVVQPNLLNNNLPPIMKAASAFVLPTHGEGRQLNAIHLSISVPYRWFWFTFDGQVGARLLWRPWPCSCQVRAGGDRACTSATMNICRQSLPPTGVATPSTSRKRLDTLSQSSKWCLCAHSSLAMALIVLDCAGASGGAAGQTRLPLGTTLYQAPRLSVAARGETACGGPGKSKAR